MLTRYFELNQLCTFKNGTILAKKDLLKGPYPIIRGGKEPIEYHSKANCPERTILCSSSGPLAGHISRYNQKVWASDCFMIQPINSKVDNDYLYYYLLSIQDQLYKSQKGNKTLHVYSSCLENLQIPVPSNQIQKLISSYLTKINSNIHHLSEAQKGFNDVLETYLKCQTINEKKGKLKNQIEPIKTGKKISRNEILRNEILRNEASGYPIYSTNGLNLNEQISDYLLNGSYILTPRNGKHGRFIKVNGKFTPSDHLYIIKNKPHLNLDYLYYYLNYITSTSTSTSTSTKNDLENLEIPLPSSTKQKEIVQYCNRVLAQSNELDQRIKENRKLFKEVLTSMV